MGRELRRMPMNFDYPLGAVWQGYLIRDSLSLCDGEDEEDCEICKAYAKVKGIPLDDEGCPDFKAYLAEPIRLLKELLDPPAGNGYQLWETTSEGAPISPVFATLDELCAWCEEGATVFADWKISKTEWMKKLSLMDAKGRCLGHDITPEESYG